MQKIHLFFSKDRIPRIGFFARLESPSCYNIATSCSEIVLSVARVAQLEFRNVVKQVLNGSVIASLYSKQHFDEIQ